MGYLAQYDNAPDDATRVRLVQTWIRSQDWAPFFQELREHRPVLVTPAFTLVSRFSDVVEVLSHETVFTARLYARSMDPALDGPFMLSRDATPVNWREKGIMRAVLRPEDLPWVRDLAGALADEALDRHECAGRLDAVHDLGRYVPVRMCGEYFGFPGPDLATMYRWSRAAQVDMFKNLQAVPALHEASVVAGHELIDYLRSVLHEKRAELDKGVEDPPQDTFSRLVRTEFPAELGFDDRRILANIAGLLVGAVETTSQAVVQVLHQILLRPETLRAATAAAEGDPPGFDPYVWEALRFNPINPLVFRVCEQPYTVAAGTPRATAIPAGTMVFALTASAMFDELAVADPHTFRIDRPDHNTLHFGFGHHTCLGQHVAGAMVPEVVRRVLLRAPRLLPAPADGIDFAGGPFPERFALAFGGAAPGEELLPA